MGLLIPFKEFIGCDSCQKEWENQCPVCKSKNSEMKLLTGESVNIRNYVFWRKDGDIYYYYEKSKPVNVNKLYKESGTSLSFKIWVEEQKAIGNFKGIKVRYPKQKKKVKNPEKHNRILEQRQFWKQFHPKRVVTLIIHGHDPACKCCYAIDNLTFDHVIPLGKKGKNSYKNGQILCYECNQLKGDDIMSINELRKLLNFKVE